MIIRVLLILVFAHGPTLVGFRSSKGLTRPKVTALSPTFFWAHGTHGSAIATIKTTLKAFESLAKLLIS
jgi:hypothetical protein